MKNNIPVNPKKMEELKNQMENRERNIGGSRLVMGHIVKSTDMSIEELKSMYRRFTNYTPQEVYEQCFSDKTIDEITMEDIKETIFAPENLVFGNELKVPIDRLLQEREISLAQYIFLALCNLYQYKTDKSNIREEWIFKIRIAQHKKLIEYLGLEDLAIRGREKQDENGTLYSNVIWLISKELIKEKGDIKIIASSKKKQQFVDTFNSKFTDEEQKEILEFINSKMAKEFVFDGEMLETFEDIADSNAKYRINEKKAKGEVVAGGEFEAIYEEEYRKTILANMSLECMNLDKMMLSVLYRYISDLSLYCDIYDSYDVLEDRDRIKKMIAITRTDINAECNLKDDEFSEEQLNEIQKNGIAIQEKNFNAKKAISILEKAMASILGKVKEEVFYNPTGIRKLNTKLLRETTFSPDEIIHLADILEEKEFGYIYNINANIETTLNEMAKQFRNLSTSGIKLLLKLEKITSEEVIKEYLQGDITDDKFHAVEEAIDKQEGYIINYSELIYEYENIQKIKNPDQKEEKMQQLKSKIKVYQKIHKNDLEKDIEQNSFELVSQKSEQYVWNKNSNNPADFSKDTIKELYSLGLISLDAIITLDVDLINYLYSSDLPEEKRITTEKLVTLYREGDILGKDLKSYILAGEIPIYIVKSADELGLNSEEAKKLLNEDKLNSKNILELYYMGVLSNEDFKDKVDSLQSDEEKYNFIYSNFSNEEYEEIFDSLLDRIQFEKEPNLYTGEGIKKGIGAGTKNIRNPIPSKLRWKLMHTIDENVTCQSLPNGHIAFIFPTYGKVLLEKMRDKVGGQNCDAYGKASHGMSIEEFYSYKKEFIVAEPNNPSHISVDRPKLVKLSKHGKIDSISHFPETWGEKVVEYIRGEKLNEENLYDTEILLLIKELKDEMIKAKESDRENN